MANKNYSKYEDKEKDPYMPEQAAQDYGKGRPSQKEDKGAAERLSVQMMRDLPGVSTAVNTRVDPYAEAKGAEGAYPFYNKNNKIINPKYRGQENVDGSSSMQMFDQPNSSFLNYFDAVELELRPNYRMMCLDKRTNLTGADVTNYGLVTDMFKAFVEKMGEIEASTFTGFDAFDYAVECSMPVTANAETDDAWSPYIVTQGEHTYYVGYAAVFLTMLNYQITLQQIASCYNAVNKNRAFRSHFKTMAWNREVSFLSTLWGKFDSKTWLNNWTTLSTNLQGEFFDAEWMETLNTLGMLCSRKSNSIIDPVQSIRVIPKGLSNFKLYKSLDVTESGGQATYTPGVTLFDSSLMKSGGTIQVIYPYSKASVVQEVGVTYSTACELVTRFMSPVVCQEWARLKLSKQSGAFTDINVASTQQYSRGIVNLIEALDEMLGYFKTTMAGIRKVIEVCVRIKINKWTHVRLGIIKDTKVEIDYNTTVSDFLSNYLTGSVDTTVDPLTQKWTGYTIFNKYYGVPAYDYYNGGCFLTFSLKNVIPGSGVRARRMPFLFDYPESTSSGSAYNISAAKCYAINRYGEMVCIGLNDNLSVQNSSVLARLAPIEPMSNVKVRIPTNVDAFEQGSSLTTLGIGSRATVSCFYHLLENLFHLGAVTSKNGAATLADFVLSADIMVLLDFEIEDITNVMIAYARGNGPIITNVTDSIIGFSVK